MHYLEVGPFTGSTWCCITSWQYLHFIYWWQLLMLRFFVSSLCLVKGLLWNPNYFSCSISVGISFQTLVVVASWFWAAYQNSFDVHWCWVPMFVQLDDNERLNFCCCAFSNLMQVWFRELPGFMNCLIGLHSTFNIIKSSLAKKIKSRRPFSNIEVWHSFIALWILCLQIVTPLNG